MGFKIGIDVGGTFTDFLLVDDVGNSKIYKVLSTPDDPSIGFMNGIHEMAQDMGMTVQEFIKDVSVIVHGTTVTTNAVLTLNGVKTGLLTTRGVRDALQMRRGIREEQYNNRYTPPPPLVERYLRYPVTERVDYKGDVLIPLNEDDVREGIKLFKKEGVKAIAVCYMHSYANSSHEKRTLEIIKEELGDQVYVTLSSELLPQIRFYDRVSTTVLNSYVGPILANYLSNLIKKLDDVGFGGVLLIMQSNGGVVTPEVATKKAAVTLLSGPAAGPMAGIIYAKAQGFNDCITVDMGGTSFDASLVKDGRPLVVTDGEINRYKLALPMLDIVTIGAGGGSIGWIDEGGLLRMGPQSAGAKPGPVCYDLGGEEPTCTDADLILGYLDKDFFAGGKIKLNYDKAAKVIEEKIAKKLGLSLVEAAHGMYHVINVNMASGVREVSVKRGYDPRDFPLIVAGGAGPIHAGMIALELEIPHIIIPKESSIFCAAGMLLSDLKHDYVQTLSGTLDSVDPAAFREAAFSMERMGVETLKHENIPEDRIEVVFSLDMRYLRQYHEVNVPVTREEIEKADFESIAKRFHPIHDKLFGYSLEDTDTPIELINIRVTCYGKTDKFVMKEEEYAGEDPSPAWKKKRPVFLPDTKDYRELDIFDGHRLKHGNRIKGPAIIEQVHTTIFVPSEYNLVCDKFGSFTMYLKDREEEVLRRVLG